MLPDQDLHETSAKVHLCFRDITPDCQANGHSRSRMLSPSLQNTHHHWIPLYVQTSHSTGTFMQNFHPCWGQMYAVNWSEIWKSEVQEAIHLGALGYLSGIRKIFSFPLFRGSLLEAHVLFIFHSPSLQSWKFAKEHPGECCRIWMNICHQVSSQKQSFLLDEHMAQGKCPIPHNSWHQLPLLPRLLSLLRLMYRRICKVSGSPGNMLTCNFYQAS